MDGLRCHRYRQREASTEAVAYGKERDPVRQTDHQEPGITVQGSRHGDQDRDGPSDGCPCFNKDGYGTSVHEANPLSRNAMRPISQMEVASEAIQMFGSYGYSRVPGRELLRDAKIFQIFEGTNEVQRIVVANNVIGKKAICA